MVEDILKRAVDALSALDFVEGVVLGGSRARGADNRLRHRYRRLLRRRKAGYRRA